MDTSATPPWAAHLRPHSALPSDTAACRSALRHGHLAEALLAGGATPALVEGARTLTHDELRQRAERVAGGLASLGVGVGDRVSFYAANALSWAVAYLGAQRLGAIVNPCNPAYRDDEIAYILQDCQPTVIVADAERLAVLQRIGGRFAWHPHIVLVDEMPEAAPPPLPPANPERPALIIYTSGTTGRPKGALLDQGAVLAQVRGVIEAWRWQASDHLILTLPFSHVHGLVIGLHGTLLSGASARVLPFSPEAVVEALQTGGTLFFGVPTMYQRLADWLDVHPRSLDGVRLFVSGSAALPPTLFARCLAVLGQPVLERFGSTEGGIVVSNPYAGPRQAGRVGYPLPGVEVRLGEQNEILLRGGQVFSGYWKNPQATHDALTDGWLRTGDVGELAEDGSLAIRGRLKEMIITGGFNVYPREVEVVLEEHPAVAEVAVAGRPSEEWGEEVTAYVVAAQPIEEATLLAYVRERLARYKCPRRVIFVPDLPRNALGKVQRARLGRAPHPD